MNTLMSLFVGFFMLWCLVAFWWTGDLGAFIARCLFVGLVYWMTGWFISGRLARVKKVHADRIAGQGIQIAFAMGAFLAPLPTIVALCAMGITLWRANKG